MRSFHVTARGHSVRRRWRRHADRLDGIVASFLLTAVFILPVFGGAAGLTVPRLYDQFLYLWFRVWQSLVMLFFWMLPWQLPRLEALLPSVNGLLAVILLPLGAYYMLLVLKERELIPALFACFGASLAWVGELLTVSTVAIPLSAMDRPDLGAQASEVAALLGLGGGAQLLGGWLLLTGQGIMMAGLLACLAMPAVDLAHRRRVPAGTVIAYALLPAVSFLLWTEAWLPAALLMLLWLGFRRGADPRASGRLPAAPPNSLHLKGDSHARDGDAPQGADVPYRFSAGQ